MPSVARVTVSSRRITIWPVLDRMLPSLTRISPTMPPVGCWTFLTFDSTTTVPGAITAPDSCVVAAQPPTPPTSTAMAAKPIRLSLRMAARVGLRGRLVAVACFGSGHHALRLGIPTTLRLPAGAAGTGGGRAGHDLAQDLVARAERLLRAVGQDQHLVAGRQRRGPVRHQDDDGAPRLGGR